MWHPSIAPLVVVAALTTSAVAQSPVAETEPSQPIATRQTYFSIPFQIQKGVAFLLTQHGMNSA